MEGNRSKQKELDISLECRMEKINNLIQDFHTTVIHTVLYTAAQS